MCDICDGKTYEQAVAETRDRIRRVGWGLQGVEPAPGIPGWTYTIGLLASYDHPELLLVDDELGRAGSILNAMGRAVRDGDIIEPGDNIDLGGCRAGVVDIHPDHLSGGVLAAWHSVHTVPGGEPFELEACQVVVHDPLPGGDRLPQVRLDLPGSALGRTGPNRAQRRAVARRRHGP